MFSLTFANPNSPAITRAGGRKHTYFPCRWPHACTWGNRICPIFGKKFNLITALFVHQSPTLAQKIDSREDWFWCKKGLLCKCRQNEFLLKTNAICTRFWAICSKTQCVLVLNAVRFGAKRSTF